MADGSVPAVILDFGSAKTKAGLTTDEAPIAIFPSVVGTARTQTPATPEEGQTFFAEEALAKFNSHVPRRPVEYGLITNWSTYEELISYTYDSRLCVEASDHPVIITEIPLNPRANREKLMQVMFETYRVPQFFLGTQQRFSLIGADHCTGLVVDLGHSPIRPVPLYELCCLPQGVLRSELCGNQLPDYFLKTVTRADGAVDTGPVHRAFRHPIEKHSFVAASYEAEEARPDSDFATPITLSDGSQATLGRGQYRCMETLFKPSLGGLECQSLPELMIDSIHRCDPTIRGELSRNILLTGGYAATPGLKERLLSELKRLAPDHKHGWRLEVHAHPAYSAWAGAKQFAELSPNLEGSATVADYDEFGPSLVHRMFF